MDVNAESYGPAVVVTCKGELTLETVDGFVKEVRCQLADGATELIVSLSGVSHVDSEGLACLLDLHDRMARESGRLTLTNLDENITKILEITRLDRTFEVCADAADAIGAL